MIYATTALALKKLADDYRHVYSIFHGGCEG